MTRIMFQTREEADLAAKQLEEKYQKYVSVRSECDGYTIYVERKELWDALRATVVAA